MIESTNCDGVTNVVRLSLNSTYPDKSYSVLVSSKVTEPPSTKLIVKNRPVLSILKSCVSVFTGKSPLIAAVLSANISGVTNVVSESLNSTYPVRIGISDLVAIIVVSTFKASPVIPTPDKVPLLTTV